MVLLQHSNSLFHQPIFKRHLLVIIFSLVLAIWHCGFPSHTYHSKQHHAMFFCHTAWRFRGSTGRNNLSYLTHSAIDSTWVADRQLTFNLHHDFFPAKMPLLRCHQQCVLCNRDHRAQGRQKTEGSSVPCRHAYTWRGKADCKLLEPLPCELFLLLWLDFLISSPSLFKSML